MDNSRDQHDDISDRGEFARDCWITTDRAIRENSPRRLVWLGGFLFVDV